MTTDSINFIVKKRKRSSSEEKINEENSKLKYIEYIRSLIVQHLLSSRKKDAEKRKLLKKSQKGDMITVGKKISKENFFDYLEIICDIRRQVAGNSHRFKPLPKEKQSEFLKGNYKKNRITNCKIFLNLVIIHRFLRFKMGRFLIFLRRKKM